MASLGEHFHMNQASNQDNKRRKQDSFIGESEDLDDEILTGVHSKHKASRRVFLVWVAFQRNRPRVDEDIRRTCPLVGCEKPFDTPDLMQQHLIGCLQVSCGSYRCYKCGKEEKIGRYHIDRCRRVENHGGRLATVFNSFRSAKRRLSHRHQPSTQQDSETSNTQEGRQYYGKQMKDGGFAELSSQSGLFNAELSGGDASQWLSEMSSQGMDFGQLEDHAFNSTSNVSISNKPDVELAGEPVYQPYRPWQEPQYPQNNTFESMKMSSMLSFQDSTSPCSPASPTEVAGWQNPTQMSPLENEHLYSDFNQTNSSRQTTQNLSGGIGLYDSPTDRDFSPPTHVLSNQSFHGVPTFTSPATNHGSCDLPELSDTGSRNFSTSSGIESSSSESYWDESGPSMILQDTELCDEPDSYNDHVSVFEGIKRFEKSSNTEQNWSLPIDDNSMQCNLSSKPLWLHGSRFHPDGENSNHNMNSSPPRSESLPWLTTSSSTKPTPPHRSASGYPIHPTACPCGFKPKGIQKNQRGNLKRHMKGCKKAWEQAHPDSSPDPKPWVCDFPNCGKRFSRCDNRRHHQRIKFHGPYARSSTSPVAGSDGDYYGSGDVRKFEGSADHTR